MKIIKYFKLPDGRKLCRMGIGTWGIGGYFMKNKYNDDENDISQIRYQLSKGLNMIDCWNNQADGHTLQLIRKSIENFDRKDYFLICKLDVHKMQSIKEVRTAIDEYLETLNVTKLDAIQVHTPSITEIDMKNLAKELDLAIKNELSDYIAVANFNKDQLNEFQKLLKNKILLNEIQYSVLNKEYQKNVTIDFCKQNNIYVMAYRVLNRGYCGESFEGNKIVEVWKDNKNLTPAQIAFNYVLRDQEMLCWMKSVNRSHINENIGAFDVELKEKEVEMLGQTDKKI
ncbi:aldo/keto reductase [Candidatus Dojkabacteria bacterium]|nr:aldo/keto reductase [Candidatus Dojkabacteria bacterium]